MFWIKFVTILLTVDFNVTTINLVSNFKRENILIQLLIYQICLESFE